MAVAFDTLAEPVAAVAVIGAIALMAVRPTLVTRRLWRGPAPIPHRAAAPFVPVVPRTYPGGRPSRWLGVAAWLLGGTSIGLMAGTTRDLDPAVGGGLGLAAAIMALTFAFANWFAGRVHIRVDGSGIHGRVLWREHGIAWRDVAELRLRYVVIGVGVRLVYYSVRSSTREVAFPSSMTGASDLRTTIERATGLTYPAPEITPTM